jgi:GMP synthase-like glutamine amidotransferase
MLGTSWGAQATIVERRRPGTPIGAPPCRRRPEVVVWEADGSPFGGLGYGHAVVARLAEAGIVATTVPLTRRPPSPEEQAAPVHVLSGGTTPATSSQPWVRAARRALHPVLMRALAGEATVIGICFGAQLVVATLAGPGAVGPNPRGLEAGLVVVHPPGCLPGRPGRRLRPPAPASPGGPGSGGALAMATVVAQIHFHHIDPAAVTALGGEVVLSNDHTTVQAFTLGPTIVGLQFHPELDPPATRSTIEAHRGLLQAHGLVPADVLATVDRLGVAWGAEPFDRYIVRPARGPLAASTAA